MFISGHTTVWCRVLRCDHVFALSESPLWVHRCYVQARLSSPGNPAQVLPTPGTAVHASGLPVHFKIGREHPDVNREWGARSRPRFRPIGGRRDGPTSTVPSRPLSGQAGGRGRGGASAPCPKSEKGPGGSGGATGHPLAGSLPTGTTRAPAALRRGRSTPGRGDRTSVRRGLGSHGSCAGRPQGHSKRAFWHHDRASNY
jgi:hypothetical protein